MHKEHKNNRTKTTTHDITWFTPSVGATSTELCFISTFFKITVLICALSCRSLQSLKLCTQSQASVHTAVEVVHSHSWDLTFPYKISLSFAFIFLTS